MIKNGWSGRFTFVVIGILAGFLVFAVTVRNIYAAPSLFDWDANSWELTDPITLSNTYTGVGQPATVFTYTISGDTDRFESFHSPETNSTVTGGLHPVQDSLFISADFVTNTEKITLTLDLSIDSANVSFLIFDVDAPNIFPDTGIDQVSVSGEDVQGTEVLPDLVATDPTCVSITGNTATGLVPSDNNSDCANVTVQFSENVQKIVIVFGEAEPAGDPEGHGIGLHDINFDPGGPTPPTETPTSTPTRTSTPTVTTTPPTPTPTPSPTPGTPPVSTTPSTPTPSTTSGPPHDHFLYLPVILKLSTGA